MICFDRVDLCVRSDCRKRQIESDARWMQEHMSNFAQAIHWLTPFKIKIEIEKTSKLQFEAGLLITWSDFNRLNMIFEKEMFIEFFMCNELYSLRKRESIRMSLKVKEMAKNWIKIY